MTQLPSSPDADAAGSGEVFASDRGDTFIINRARLLGRPGASGSVFAGTDAGGGPVAVKEVLVRTDPVRAAAEWRLVDRELEVARRASGRPGLLPIHDHAHLDDRLLIVMPMADRSLGEAIADGMSAEDAVAALRELAEALQQLAVAGIVHRDIKPANVLRWGGRWCVADFGISRIVEAGTATQTWAGTGTLEYRAPEVWRGEPQTALSDLYALGCLAAEILTGEVAFPGPDFKGQHEMTMPTLPADVEPRLARVVLMLLAKAPEQRPQDARQVIELLARSRELTDAQRVLQRRAAAAERRARETEVHDEQQRRLDDLRVRARHTLRLLWDDLADEARTAVPDATGSEQRDVHFLVVADARLAAVNVGAGEAEGPLLAAALVVHDGEGSDGVVVANLVAEVVDDLPRWKVVTWSANALSRPRVNLGPRSRRVGLAIGAFHEQWRHRRDPVPPLIAEITDATPKVLLDLFSSSLEDS